MKIMFVGDVSLGEYYPSFGHGPRSYLRSRNVFGEVRALFNTADLVIGNLEASITDCSLNEKDPESMVLRGNPDDAHILKNAGFGILQVANNHTVQHSLEGFDDTLKLLNDLSVKAVGINNENVVCIEQEDIKIGFLAASEVPDNTHKKQQRYQRLDDDFIAKVIKEIPKYDHFIVMLHWGLEASTKPLNYQRKIAKKLYEAGVRAIIGSHPHLFYEIEKRDNFISAYSLGNFVFDLCWDKRMLKSGILSLEFSKLEVKAELWPVEIKENGCLPTPLGSAITINETLIPYDLGSKMGWQQTRKIFYLFTRILNGNTPLKIKFLVGKMIRAFGLHRT